MNRCLVDRLCRRLRPLGRPFARLTARLALVWPLLVPLLAPPPAAAASPADCPPVAQAPTPEQVQANLQAARDRGFLWRIRKDGRSSWLYGTIHVGKLAWAFPGPRVREALVNAQSLALELDLTDPKVLEQLARSTAGDTRFKLPHAAQQRLAKQAEAACIGGEMLAGQHPVMQAITLTVLAARRDGLDPAFAQELALGGFARASAKPIVSLESAEQQAALLVPADAERATAIAEQTLAQLEQGASRAMLLRIAQAWEQGDLDELTKFEQWCGCIENEDDRRFLRRMNDERNGPMAERIDALHRGGRTVFAAVGSLHMTGPQGLPQLMQQRGYEVERVVFAPR